MVEKGILHFTEKNGGVSDWGDYKVGYASCPSHLWMQQPHVGCERAACLNKGKVVVPPDPSFMARSVSGLAYGFSRTPCHLWENVLDL